MPQDLKVMIVAAFVIAVGYGLVAPVLPQFAASFGVGAAASGAVISAFALMRVAGAPAAGPLVTRLGERAVYLWGLGIVAGSSLATAFAPSYPLLLVLRGIGGSQRLVEALQTRVRVEGTEDPAHVKAMLREELLKLVDPTMDRSLALDGAGEDPGVVLVVGVNGAGKPTTVGKLARVRVAEEKSLV
ncbi:hypothetical protein SA13R_05210, partial [Rothia kristinae]